MKWKKISPTVKNIAYPSTSDPSGTVSRTYGVFQEGSGLNHRERFIVNPDGIVMAVEVLIGPVERNVQFNDSAPASAEAIYFYSKTFYAVP